MEQARRFFALYPTPTPSPLTGEGRDRGAAHTIEIAGTPTFVLPRRGGGMEQFAEHIVNDFLEWLDMDGSRNGYVD